MIDLQHVPTDALVAEIEKRAVALQLQARDARAMANDVFCRNASNIATFNNRDMSALACRIIMRVAAEMGISVEEVMHGPRTQINAQARAVVMTCLYELGASNSQAAKVFGKHHSSTIHARKTVFAPHLRSLCDAAKKLILESEM